MMSMLSLSVSAQEKTTRTSIHPNGFISESSSPEKIGRFTASSRIADSFEIVALLDFFEESGLDKAYDGFWYQLLQKSLEANEKSTQDNQNERSYNSESAVYVPKQSKNVDAIIFDWSEQLTIAIITDIGFLVLYEPEEIVDDWDIFVKDCYQYMSNHDW